MYVLFSITKEKQGKKERKNKKRFKTILQAFN